MIELGRIDIITKVSIFSSHNTYPREGNFEAALHVMSYFKGGQNLRLSLDPRYPTIDYEKFKDNDWMEFYGDVKEVIPLNPPTPLGNSVYL